VGDLSNRLFCIPPLQQWGDTSGSESRFGEVEGLVRALNAQLFTVDDAQLAGAREIVLVAGTQAKALPMYHLLHEKALPIRLVTDSRAATALLQLPDGLPQS
jgi:DNA-binding transcriptional regulator LsrR (DeoR family)